VSDFIALRCSSTGRLLAKVNEEGLHVFCKQQNTQHLITWEKLHQIEKNTVLGEQKNPVYIEDKAESRIR
jgi:hypothetical protein